MNACMQYLWTYYADDHSRTDMPFSGVQGSRIWKGHLSALCVSAVASYVHNYSISGTINLNPLWDSLGNLFSGCGG